jgi:4a-hydroxytetrahydrobiopterin dehydratase
MSALAAKTCTPCHGSVPPLKGADLVAYSPEVPDWTIVDQHHLTRRFTFPNFRKALDFTNRIGELAEAEGHHPDILLAWGKVEVTVWTHAADGLTENDFILAAKIDQLFQPES